MSVITKPTDEYTALSEFWEKVDLFLYVVIITVVTPYVARMLAGAWRSGEMSRSAVAAIEQAIGISHPQFILVGFGGFAGLVALILLDEMKRIQGMLLVLASVIALYVFRSQGLFYPLYPIQNVEFLTGGFLGSFILGGGAKVRQNEPPYEFRRATTAIFVTVFIILVAGFLERNINLVELSQLTSLSGGMSIVYGKLLAGSGEQFIVDFVSASLFLTGAYLFTSYQAKTEAFVLGVQRAGKTLLAAALNIAAEEEAEHTRLNPSEPLSRLVNSLRSADLGWGNDDYTGPTAKGEYYLLEFQTRAGNFFKEYVEIDVLDYAGEYIDRDLVERVADIVPRSRFSVRWLVYVYESMRGVPKLPEQASGLDSGEIQRVLAKQIVHSDILVIIVDSGSLVSKVPYGRNDYEAQQDLSEYLSSYVQILRHLHQSILPEKEVVVVASKADYLQEIYRETDTHLTFFNWVNFYLLESDEGREKLEPLLNQAQVDCIYPIYYRLDENTSVKKGEPIPEHPIEVYGNHELLNRLKGGQ